MQLKKLVFGYRLLHEFPNLLEEITSKKIVQVLYISGTLYQIAQNHVAQRRPLYGGEGRIKLNEYTTNDNKNSRINPNLPANEM
jgi:hypothetical protein